MFKRKKKDENVAENIMESVLRMALSDEVTLGLLKSSQAMIIFLVKELGGTVEFLPEEVAALIDEFCINGNDTEDGRTVLRVVTKEECENCGSKAKSKEK